MTAGFKIKAVTIPERDIEHKPLYQQHDIEERGIIMKYTVKVISNFNVTEFESNSRNAKQHLIENGGHTCKVYNRKGEQVSECRYSDEFGYYRCNF